MNLYGADSQEPLTVCSQLTVSLNSASSRSSPHLANANNNSNAHNGIEDKSTVNPYRTKANIMLNGGMEGVEAEEEEEEEEEETSLGSPVMSSPAHHAEEEHHPPHHLQEMHPSQFPMSGDLPTLDHGMPSPTLGFDLSSCSEHEGTTSPSISPNSPSSASYGSSKLDSTHSHPLPTTPSTISPSSNLSSPRLHLHNTIIHSGSLLAGSPNPLPLPPSFLLPYSQGTDGTSARGSTGASESSDQLMEEGEEEINKPHVCLWDNCNTEFPTLSSLVAHLDRGHTASMVHYVCLWKDCPREMKPFDARYKLVTHLRCHTGEKPYKCDVPGCTRSFSRLENLKLHVRTHTGEKPYICHYEKCNKRFNNTSDRAKHMKTHITRKPYACKVPGCGKSYTDPSSMRKHVKFAHRMRESHSEGSSSSWSYKSPKKATSPTAIPGSSLLCSTSVVQSPEMLLHPSIPTAPTITRISASLSPPNRMSVIQSDSPPSSFSPSSSSSLDPNVHSVFQTQPAVMASTMAASPSPMVPVSVLQVPNSGIQQPTAVTTEPRGMQPVLMQVDGTQQKVMLLVPASSAPTTFGGNVMTRPLATEVNGKGDRHETTNPRNAWQGTVPSSKVVSVVPNRPAVLVSPSETSHSRTSSVQQQLSVTPQSQESDLIKQQVHMKIAHLQNQMLTSQQYVQLQTTQPSLSPELVTEQVSRPVSLATAMSPLKETTAARTKAKALPLHVVPAQQTPQPGGAPVVFSTLGQGVMLHSVQPQVVNGVLSPQVAQYFQPTNIVQLPNLASMNVAQSLPHPAAAAAAAAASAQGSASPFAVKPLTVVTPAQVVGVGPCQTLVLPSGQLVPMVPPSTTPHVLIPPVAPSHNNRS